MKLLIRIKKLFRKRRWANGNEIWETLPPEIVLCIANYLNAFPVTRASFALTTRRNLCILGKDVLKFEKRNSRFRLLQRLDMDGISMADILCPMCHVFHPPRMARGWSTEKEASRACVKFGEMREKTESPFLPYQIHFDVVNFMTKRDRLKQAIYTGITIQSTTNYTHEDEQASLWHIVATKVIEGHLLVKTEVVLTPGTHRDDSLQAVPKLLEMMEERPEIGHCCGHYKWAAVKPFVFHPNESDEVSRHSSLSQMDHHCLWTHPETCHIQRGLQANPKLNLGYISSCPFCYTDMTITAFSTMDDENRTYVALTSWKDLGSGKDVNDRHWKSHLYGEDTKKANRTSKYGSIHEIWESTFLTNKKVPPNWVKKRVVLPYGYKSPT